MKLRVSLIYYNHILCYGNYYKRTYDNNLDIVADMHKIRYKSSQMNT